MTTLTYGEALARHDIAIPDHLIADAAVPVLADLQRQGDLLIVPISPVPLGERVTDTGVQLVTGEATNNTHWLDAAGEVHFRRGAGLQVGTIAVADDAVAYVTHTDEHGSLGLAPGYYEVRRQRELADEIRVVAD